MNHASVNECTGNKHPCLFSTLCQSISITNARVMCRFLSCPSLARRRSLEREDQGTVEAAHREAQYLPVLTGLFVCFGKAAGNHRPAHRGDLLDDRLGVLVIPGEAQVQDEAPVVCVGHLAATKERLWIACPGGLAHDVPQRGVLVEHSQCAGFWRVPVKLELDSRSVAPSHVCVGPVIDAADGEFRDGTGSAPRKQS